MAFSANNSVDFAEVPTQDVTEEEEQELKAWFCEEAEMQRWTAREERKPRTC